MDWPDVEPPLDVDFHINSPLMSARTEDTEGDWMEEPMDLPDIEPPSDRVFDSNDKIPTEFTDPARAWTKKSHVRERAEFSGWSEQYEVMRNVTPAFQELRRERITALWFRS